MAKIEVDLTAQKTKTQQEQIKLTQLVVNANNIAEWMFYDCFYNCDKMALQRTLARLRTIEAEYDADMVFGLVAYWAMRAYWKMRDAFKIREVPFKPDLKPDADDVQASLENDNHSYVLGLQFFSTMTHENALTAKAIWDQAYEKGPDVWLGLAQTVLIASLRCQRQADSLIMAATSG